VVRIIRFGAEAALAVHYGRRMIGWMDSDIFHDIAAVFMIAAFALTALSLLRLELRATRPRRQSRHAL